jgi:hypothetical protein
VLTLVVVSLEYALWGKLERLDLLLHSAYAPSNQVGGRIREGVTQMKLTLFRYQLSSNETDLEAFRAGSRHVGSIIAESKAVVTTSSERELLNQVGRAFDRLLEESAEYAPLKGIRRGTAEIIANRLDTGFADLLQLTDKLAGLQTDNRAALQKQSQAALSWLRVTLRISLIAVAALLASVFFLAYRAVLEPLKTKLSQSQIASQRHEKLCIPGGPGHWCRPRNP